MVSNIILPRSPVNVVFVHIATSLWLKNARLPVAQNTTRNMNIFFRVIIIKNSMLSGKLKKLVSCGFSFYPVHSA